MLDDTNDRGWNPPEPTHNTPPSRPAHHNEMGATIQNTSQLGGMTFAEKVEHRSDMRGPDGIKRN